MKRRKIFASAAMLLTAVTALAATVLGSGAYAQQGGSGSNAQKISPVRTDLVIDPGATKTVDLFLQNITDKVSRLHPIVNDFTVRPGNETGQPDIILDEDKSAPTHSLKQFVKPLQDITLQPGEQKTVTVTITVPAGSAGGGYFGAVRFEPASDDANRQVNLSGSVGSLLLVKVPGDIKEDLRLISFDVRKGDNSKNASSFYTSKKGLKSVARFESKSNVQLQPFGKVILKNQSGKVLSTTEINNTEPRGNVLPDSIRRFEIDLDKAGSFGKYTIEGNFGYGSSGQLLTGKKTFYVVPVAILIVAIVLIALIVLAIFVLPKALKAYNKSVIRKANKSRR